MFELEFSHLSAHLKIIFLQVHLINAEISISITLAKWVDNINTIMQEF